jgi:hypothetical protein
MGNNKLNYAIDEKYINIKNVINCKGESKCHFK